MGLIILVIILLLRGGGREAKVPSTSKSLESYASTNAEVSVTIDGPVNANSLHQSLRITADRNNVTYEEIQGYDGNVTEIQRFPNTENSYDVFLRALKGAGFTQGVIDEELGDERGKCPISQRYVFKLTQDGRDLQRYWATNCEIPRTYQGNVSLTLQLFQTQVPNYSQLRQNLTNLGG